MKQYVTAHMSVFVRINTDVICCLGSVTIFNNVTCCHIGVTICNSRARARVCARACACVRACVCARARARVCVCVCVCVCVKPVQNIEFGKITLYSDKVAMDHF